MSNAVRRALSSELRRVQDSLPTTFARIGFTEGRLEADKAYLAELEQSEKDLITALEPFGGPVIESDA